MGLSNDLSCEAGSLSCCHPNPHGRFNQRFACVVRSASLHSPPFVQFICARMWGRGVLPAALPALFSATLSPALSVYMCTNVGPQGLLVVRLPAPFVVCPTLRQSRSCHGHASPLHPGCLSPPLLPVWMNVSFLSTWCRTSLPFYFM